MTVAVEYDVHGARTALRRERELRIAYFRPKPKLSVSEWSDRYRILSRNASAEPGKWDTNRAPYQRAILDALSDPSIHWVVFMKPTQVGATEMLTNVTGYFIDQDPSPILVVQPTIEMGRTWSIDRFEPMIRESPRMRKLVRKNMRREKGDTILHKSFPGGQLTITGANSAASLAMRPIRVVLADEVDRYPESAGEEGDPLTLAVRRTATFSWNRKIFVPSTPTVKGASRIEKLFDESTQHRYYVPCPHCHKEQLLKFGGKDESYGLKWEEVPDQPPLKWRVEYLCEHCGALIPETAKSGMLAAGQWRATFPDRTVVGFHLNALYSPWMSWAEIIDEWYKARGNRELLKVFVNTLLAETWEDDSEKADGTVLLSRAEQYEAEVPAYTALLTAGVDTQGDRLECDVWAWGAGEEAALIRHETIWGDPAKNEVWEKLALILQRPWKHEHGSELKVRVACVDSGGHHTDAVYRFCKRRLGLQLWPVKGVGGEGRAPVTPPARKTKAKAKVVTLGTNALKDMLYARVKIDKAGPGCIHLPKGITAAWVAQLTSEVVLHPYVNGRRVRKYELPSHARNEALDCYQYALAALMLLGETTRERLGQMVEDLQPKEQEEEKPPPPPPARKPFMVKRRGWMNDY